jgi:hypothetical protein
LSKNIGEINCLTIASLGVDKCHKALYNYKKYKKKTMKRRVSIALIFSESGMVEDRYESFIEKHLGVSNRNRKRVELDGTYR